MTHATTMRRRHRFDNRIARTVLLISFLFFFGRFVYSAIGAWYHHQDKVQSQPATLSTDTPSKQPLSPQPEQG